MKEYWETLNTVKRIKLILSLISVLLITIFAFQNWEKSEVSFVFFSLKVPITLLILVAMITGYFISSLYSFKKIRVKENEINELKKKIEAISKDRGDFL
ncbi:MAG: LapA family protein [Flavobacteriia bacterium]|nr:LapA family protein [Flavobacteriia bacterium]